MSDSESLIKSIQKKNFIGRLVGYSKLTGPGWLQSAVTLGGGSLAGALYLGVIAGYTMMWLQPLAMLLGVVMLIALSHITLSDKQNPFENTKKFISPVLAWGWLVATIIADIVFCTAQSSLGVATVQQNLGFTETNPYFITVALSVVAFISASLYALGSNAVQKLELILKILVAMVMLSFAAAAGVLLFSGRVEIVALLKGLIPNPTSLFTPADSLQPLIAATGQASEYWDTYISNIQRDRIIAAFGTAVGINMTFLIPYSLIKRKWTTTHRQLSRYDLVLALLLPFSIATGLLVVSAASNFHGQHADVLQENGKPFPELEAGYYKILSQKLSSDGVSFENDTAMKAAADALPRSERLLAASLTNRDAKQLAKTLSPLMGDRASNLIFGIGILAMALSTMMVHMLMNGFAFSQALGAPGSPKPFIAGAAMPALLAIFAPLAWSGDAKTSLLIPAAVIATVFLPIAYLSIFLLINSKVVLQKEDRAKFGLNILMLIAIAVALFASVWSLINRGTAGMIGIVALIIMTAIGLAGFFKNQKKYSQK